MLSGLGHLAIQTRIIGLRKHWQSVRIKMPIILLVLYIIPLVTSTPEDTTSEAGEFVLGEDLVEKNITEGDILTLVCEYEGHSSQSLIFSWRKNHMEIPEEELDTEERGNVVRSKYVLSQLNENEIYFTCGVFTSASLNRIANRSAKVTVLRKPLANVLAEQGYEMTDGEVRQGGAFSLLCKVEKDNPLPNEYRWYLNGEQLEGEAKQHFYKSSADVSDAGNYSCYAENSVGGRKSSTLSVKVKYPPECGNEERKIYITDNDVGQEKNITCNITGYPMPYDDAYRWVSDLYGDLDGRSRTIPYNVSTLGNDTLRCWGENEEGDHKTPCIIRIIPAILPDPISNCTVDGLLKLSCETGQGEDDGTQNFTVVIQTRDGLEVFTEINTALPIFTLERLDDCQEYNIIVRADNAVGSRKFDFPYTTTCSGPQPFENPKIIIPLVIVAAILVAATIFLGTRCWKRRNLHRADNLPYELEEVESLAAQPYPDTGNNGSYSPVR